MPCENMELGRGGALFRQGRGNPTVASLREGFHTPSPNALYRASKTSSPRKASVARSAADLGAIRTNRARPRRGSQLQALEHVYIDRNMAMARTPCTIGSLSNKDRRLKSQPA